MTQRVAASIFFMYFHMPSNVSALTSVRIQGPTLTNGSFIGYKKKNTSDIVNLVTTSSTVSSLSWSGSVSANDIEYIEYKIIQQRGVTRFQMQAQINDVPATLV